MDRRAAGALLALAACFASAAAAPTAGNQTALDLYDGSSEGCYYNFQHYGEGDRIMTNEPCLNCTCHNRMLMCYLRVCPFTKPIGQDCSVEKRADQCCPIVTCPDVPVDLLTSTSTSSPAEYGETGVGKLDRYGCSINGKYFSEGSKVPSTPNKPCEHCYCIRNMTTCVMQECTLHVDGCTPIYHKDVCCPVRYSCDHPEDEILLLDDMTTTVRPTPGFLLTTTTLSPVTQMTQDCVHDDQIFADGALIKTEKACQHCYCMKGDIVCVVQECGTPMENEGKNCTSMPPREGQCCPDTYICESDELTTESKTDFTTESSLDQVTTLTPPRRVNVEGSGYRNEPDELFTEVPTFEPETEGSGEEPFKPIDAGEMFIPEKETPLPFVTTEHDENVDLLSPSTTKIPLTDFGITETAKIEPDKGENTVPSGGIDEHNTEASIKDNITPEYDASAIKPVPTTESYFDETTTILRQDDSSIYDTITTESDVLTTKPALIDETTITDYQSPSLIDKTVTAEITEPTASKQEDEKILSESTTLKETEEFTTKPSDFTASDVITTESTTAFVEQAAKTTTAQLPEEENEVLLKEPTTESSLEPSKLDVVPTTSEPPLTKQPEVVTEVPTASEDQFDTTPANPVDNEIDEEPFPTSSPGRIPGEGDCLLDGVTYSNESIIPSSNNCHSSCKCISSIIKCDPIVCSAPPDYMDNCQPMYDPPESCCPTYVCDHTKETVPPQSHSQMSGTESPAPTATIECNGDQCVVIKDKDESTKPSNPCTSGGCSDDSSRKPDDCGAQECQGTGEKTDGKPHPSGSTEECIGDKCTSLQEHCAGGNCEIPITKDQSCDSEYGCKIPVKHPCQGEDCKIEPEIAPAKDETTLCSAGGCNDTKVPERTSDCEGESCLELPASVGPEDTEKCKDGSDCFKPPYTESANSECNEDSCIKKPVSDISKPATDGCTDSECISQDHTPQITDAPIFDSDYIPKATEIPESHETKSEETFTDVTKPTDAEDSGKTTQSVVEETESTTQHDIKTDQKEEESPPSQTMIPVLETQTPDVQQYETTITQLADTKIQDSEVTPMPLEEISTLEPKLTESDTKDRITELPDIMELDTKLPELVSEPIDQFDVLVTTSHTDTIDDVEKHHITTAPPTSVHVSHDASMEVVTKSQNKQTTTSIPTDMDDQGVTTETPQLEPELVESHTESPGTEVPIEETKEPVPNVTERTESDTSVQEQKDTDRVTEESVNQEKVPVTSKYDSETKSPMQSIAEEKLDSITNAPETPETTISPIIEADKQETLLPDSILSSEETMKNKPGDDISVSETTMSPNTNDEAEELQTKSSVTDIIDTTAKPEVLIDVRISSQAPELTTELPEIHVTESQEYTTRLSETPQEIEDHGVVTPSENMEPNEFETETPMSIVKEEGEINLTQLSPTGMDQEPSTKKPELLMPHSTESYTSETEQISSVKPETGEIEKDNEKMPNLSEEESTDVVTKKPDYKIETTTPVFKDDTSTEQPIKVSEETEAPASEPSTEETPVSVIPEKSSSLGHDGSATEATIQITDALQDITEKVPESFTEISTQTVSEAVDIVTPTRDESEVKKHDVTEIPELTIHEHNDSIFTTMKSGDTVTETVTELPDTSPTVTQDNITDKEVTKTFELQDTATIIPEIPVKEMQEEEIVTNAPEHQQTEINEIKPQDVPKDIPEQLPTESQKIPTETPESEDAFVNIPVISVTEKEKELTEISTLDDITTSAPKISVTQPAKEETLIPELQDTNVPDITATDSVSEVTDAPESQDMITKASEISAEEPLEESTEEPEPQDTATKSSEAETTVTTDASISVITTIELDKDVTETPEMHDTDTKIHETPERELQKETTVIPESQDATTKTPEVLVTETQKEITEIPDVHDSATIIPNIPSIEQEEASEAPETLNAVTDMPEISATKPPKETTEVSAQQDVVTESQKEVTEPQKEDTESPVVTNVSNIPVFVTESQKDITESPGTQDTATNVPEISLTESQKEITEKPDLYNTASFRPEKPTTESQKEVSEPSETQDSENVIPDVPGTDAPMIVTAELEQNTEPHKDITEAPEDDTQQDITESPEAQATNIPKISETIPQKEETAEPELQDSVTNVPETAVTDLNVATVMPESQNTVTNIPYVPVTEQQKEATKLSESPEITTNTSELSETEEPNKTVTEVPVQVFVTKPVDRTQTEAGDIETKTEESTITAIDIITESPLKITPKLDEHTESESSETDMHTESPKFEQSPTLPTEAEVSNEQSTKVPESLVTEPEHKATEFDSVTTKPTPGKPDDEKPKEEENIVTESSIAVPTKTPEYTETEKPVMVTELPISQESIEFGTKSPHLGDTKIDVTKAPEDHITEEEERVTVTPEDTRRAEATSPSLELEDNVTKSPEQPEETFDTKSESPETTPYLVLLEEHTHKKDINTMSPDDEVTTLSSSLPLDYESSTSEPSIDKTTEPVPITETEKPTQEEAISLDKDQSIQETTTTIPEKITEHTLVSEETSTIGFSPAFDTNKDAQVTSKPTEVESNEISTSAPTPAEEQSETEKPFIPGSTSEVDQDIPSATEKHPETTAPEEEFILATTKATTVKIEEELTTPSPIVDKFGKPDESPKPVVEDEKLKPETIEELPKPVTNEVQTTEEVPQPDDESHFPPSGTSSYGQEPDYGEEDQAFGPGTCRYGGKVYVSAQQIPRDDPCDFCFCFRSDIICLQQSCPPPIHGCHEEPIQGFCCPRYECPVSMATSVNVTTTTTTTTTTLPPHFLPHAYPGMVQRRGCQIKGHTYKVGEVVRASSGPCLHCTCGGDGQMKCDPKVCTPEPMLRQMIAAAVSAKRRR